MRVVANKLAKLGVVAVNHGASARCRQQPTVTATRIGFAQNPASVTVARRHLAAAGEVFSRISVPMVTVPAAPTTLSFWMYMDHGGQSGVFRNFNHGVSILSDSERFREGLTAKADQPCPSSADNVERGFQSLVVAARRFDCQWSTSEVGTSFHAEHGWRR
jgi:hypothetical protein